MRARKISGGVAATLPLTGAREFRIVRQALDLALGQGVLGLLFAGIVSAPRHGQRRVGWKWRKKNRTAAKRKRQKPDCERSIHVEH
jgi:hypothetical protein